VVQISVHHQPPSTRIKQVFRVTEVGAEGRRTRVNRVHRSQDTWGTLLRAVPIREVTLLLQDLRVITMVSDQELMIKYGNQQIIPKEFQIF
jgi:hypothetical protein